MNRQLQALLEKDPLTGLLNKSAFEEKTAARLRSANGSDGLTLLMVDLDDFKGINDRFGHPCGDYVLQQTAPKVAKRLSHRCGDRPASAAMSLPSRSTRRRRICWKSAAALHPDAWRHTLAGARG